MFSFMLYKCLLLLLLVVSVCLANKESEMEQPTKLLGGVLHKPEKCGFKADTSSTVKLHYRARAWGQDTFFENTYQREAPLEFKLGKRKLVKAYGELGLSNLVPPNTAIVVDVEMQAQQGDSTSPGAFLAAQQQGQPSQEKKDQ
ncbi:hypothetical protein RO3G_10606 [Rhizopus delemar RA 99-880]|uniref:peptidylprolyl isomerase n=1 Tax=Rhizopus delemar (strain RA 99-880 / ATCC MYA-4621 / FGSC 9543 / NRRL 43880) TaxID=246409 RepID=I1CBR6_RHIO9|nr:hypothetical protein RO3G_10606 [Rhizopus delemar RA 99-880]|eukprot:EIE85896.1 hypothetical protein RO3G_10606 [Rhizopus delemar RA 99-880]